MMRKATGEDAEVVDVDGDGDVEMEFRDDEDFEDAGRTRRATATPAQRSARAGAVAPAGRRSPSLPLVTRALVVTKPL
jgi:hypothetical protein